MPIDNKYPDKKVWYKDGDSDGWRDDNHTKETYTKPEGYVDKKGDCDDEHYDVDNICNKLTWVLDQDSDNYYLEGTERQEYHNWDVLVNSKVAYITGYQKRETMKGEDCDDKNKFKTKNCSLCDNTASSPPEELKCGPKECRFNQETCAWEKISQCKKTIGYLHDANFAGKQPVLGNNITLATDNFRNDDWSINKVNCGSGKVPKGSEVNVLSTTPEVRTLSDGRKINYFKVEYDECPKGNNSNTGTIDSNKPCSDCFKGNPIKGNMRLAKQKSSGLKGATMGWTRKKSKVITDPVTKKKKRILVPKQHKGIDIQTEKGDPIYAMFDGTAKLKTNTDKKGNVIGGGYYVALTSKVDGKTIETWYFHMKKDTRVSGEVKAGDIIGYQGDSGNLKNAVANKSTPIHVHIQLYENGKLRDPLPYLKADLDKDTGKFTNESDCNN